MKLSIYEYKDYKKFVNTWLEHSPHGGHGLRKKLAEAMDCQTAYVSHVFSGEYHLSPEQGLKCAQWMQLSPEDTHYFLLLINYHRAGTKDLEKYYNQQIALTRSEQVDLKKRSAITDSLSHEDQNIYYSHWVYAAIHMAVTIPQLQTISGLQEYFGLPMNKITQVLNFLVKTNLVSQDKSQFKIGKGYIHLEKSSPLLLQHHTNWRLRSLESIAQKDTDDIHYSGVITLSKEDFDVVREKMAELLKEVVELTKKSKEETMACLCFDWFNL